LCTKKKTKKQKNQKKNQIKNQKERKPIYISKDVKLSISAHSWLSF